MPVIEIEIEQLKQAFESLSTKDKIKLVEDFEKETRRARWDALTIRIRSRTKKNPVSQKEINRTCEEVRQELYEKRTQSHN